MITLLKKLFGKTSSTDFATLIEEGAIILDVRTRNEYAGGHVKNSLNIPLNELPAQLKKLKKEKTIITCCASGMRSASAKNVLQSNGFTAYNGGSWVSLKKYGR
ncbi:MAG: rhodanese-like domain-containing protein [Bacteroidetes bacterium]|nr:rhodanese-like domain-containing protein [Bacteroidota bacterium]